MRSPGGAWPRQTVELPKVPLCVRRQEVNARVARQFRKGGNEAVGKMAQGFDLVLGYAKGIEDRVAVLEALSKRGFLGRLLWLLLGR